MQKIFVISDTWFNRILDDQDIDVSTRNQEMIDAWRNVVAPSDIVYVLGGFAISDIYDIVLELPGEIHFLNNHFGDDSRTFVDELKNKISGTNENQSLRDDIVFETDQIVSLNELDVILSYFPLEDWCGKSSGTLCLHGYNGKSDLVNNNISCVSWKWNSKPIDIVELKNKLNQFRKKI